MKPEIYLAWHDTGIPGTWLSWFINQHKNFPQPMGSYMYNKPMDPILDAMDIGEHRPHPLHFASSIGPWNAPFLKDTPRTKHPGGGFFGTSHMLSHTYLSIDKVVQQARDKSLNNFPQFSKVCLKLFSNHMTMENPMFIKSMFDKIRKEVTIKKNITARAGTASKLISDRLNDLEGRKPDSNDELMIKYHERRNTTEWLPKLAKLAPTYVVDFGKLLNYDYEEYNKLLIEIDEEPLDNWKELVDIIKEVFTKYK